MASVLPAGEVENISPQNNNKKPRVRQFIDRQPSQSQQIKEEATQPNSQRGRDAKEPTPKQSLTKINLTDNPDSIIPNESNKFNLTTDSPFQGIKTTKARIEPIRSPQGPGSLGNSPFTKLQQSEVQITVSTPKQSKMARGQTKYYSSQSKILPPLDSKANLDKKNHDTEGTRNGGITKKDSIDIEAEKQAFITDITPRNGSRNQKQITDFDKDHDDEISEYSEDKNRGRQPRKFRDTSSSIKPKPKYDPEAILRKIRNKDFLSVEDGGRHRGTSNSPGQTEVIHKTKSPQPRDFTVMRSKKINLFEGIPYVPYDIFLRQDANMQNVMIRDLLKILLDKAKTLRNLFADSYRMERLIKNIDESEQIALNVHTEDTIGLLNAIASLIMQEFRDSIEKIGIKASPIYDNPNLKLNGFDTEMEKFIDNSQLFIDTIDHLRDCIDCYHVMSRQKDRKPIPDADCSDLLQFIARARYNLGQLYEALRIIEKHVDSKLEWIRENKGGRKTESQKAQENKIKDTYKLLNELLHNKFNTNKNKGAATRESKVVLNQEAEDEKFFAILQNQKQLKKKEGRDIVDNRKLIILNRLLNPIEDPQIHAAIKVAQEKTKVQLSRDLIEFLDSKSKAEESKSATTSALPLKTNLEKILSNKKLTDLCFEFHDGKEHQDILDKLSTKHNNVEMKEVVSSVFSHTKTKRHLGCLFDGEALKEGNEQLNDKKGKLPKIKHTHTPRKDKMGQTR